MSEPLLIGGSLLALAYVYVADTKSKKRNNKAVALLPYEKLTAQSPKLLNNRKLTNILQEDPVSLAPIAKPVYLAPNLQNGKISALYNYNTIAPILHNKNAKSPLTRRPFGPWNVMKYQSPPQ